MSRKSTIGIQHKFIAVFGNIILIQDVGDIFQTDKTNQNPGFYIVYKDGGANRKNTSTGGFRIFRLTDYSGSRFPWFGEIIAVRNGFPVIAFSVSMCGLDADTVCNQKV